MKTQIENFSLKQLLLSTSIPGWVLLSRPIINLLFSRQRGLEAYAAVDTSAMVFIAYTFVAFFISIRYLYNSYTSFGKEILTKSPIAIFILYTIWGGISMGWSVLPFLTGYRAFECLTMCLLIVCVLQALFETGNLKYVILWSLIYCTWDIGWSIIRKSQWSVDLFVILGASQMMSTCFFFMALYFVPRQWYNYLIIIMSIFSMSTVAYIGMGLGLISSFWQEGRIRVLAIFGGICLIIISIGIGPYTILKNTIFFDKNEISLEETSGRNHLLDATIECVDQYPLGLGFFAAEPYIIYTKGMSAIGAHNSLFSAGMGMGIPGIIIIGIFFLAMGRITFSRFIPTRYKSIIIGCFCVAFLHCMGNPSVGTRVFGAWIPCMYIFVLICGMYIYGKYFEPNNEDDTYN